MKIRLVDGKLQYDINREAAKISTLLSGKIDNNEYLTGEEILPSNQEQIIEQAKFTYSPLGKTFEKQTKAIEDQGEKQIDALKYLKSFKSKEVKSEETKPIDYDDYHIKKIAEIRDQQKKIDFNNLTYIFKEKLLQQILLVLKDHYMFLKGYIVVI